MTATIIDGKSFAADLRAKVKDAVATLPRRPRLVVLIVGDDAPSQIYVRAKHKAAGEVGIHSIIHQLDETIPQDGMLRLIGQLNRDPSVDGILVQLPLPPHIDSTAVINEIDPSKDVDGFHPTNAGRLMQRDPGIIACTPLGCLMLLKKQLGELRGLHAVMVGASNIVGRPMGQLLLLEGCTVTMTHRFTKNTPELARQADILVAAAGKPGLVTADWIKPGATVIDVGINRVDGKIVGDVDFEGARKVAGAITPVPGGVGPMTIAVLLKNTLEAAIAHA